MSLLAVGATSCLSDWPIDAVPQVPIDSRLLGKWRCLSTTPAEKGVATLQVTTLTPNLYALDWREPGKKRERYEAYASTVGDKEVVLNIRVQEGPKQTLGIVSRAWTFARYSFTSTGHLHGQLLTDKGLPDAPQSETAVRAAIFHAIAAEGFVDFCECTRK